MERYGLQVRGVVKIGFVPDFSEVHGSGHGAASGDILLPMEQNMVDDVVDLDELVDEHLVGWL